MEIYNGNYCVYVHTNKANGKKYVGQTCQKPEKRWHNGRGYIENIYFWRSIQKYGWDNFEHEVVASNLTKDEADNFEKLLINKLDLMNPMYGYNLTAGGTHGCMSEYTKRRMSDARSGENHPWFGKHLPEETKKKISESHMGEKNHFYGKHHSEETKRKMSESMKNAERNNSKKVYQYDLCGNFIKEWSNMTRFAEAYHVGRTTVMNHCRNGKPFKDEFILRLEKI